MDGRRQLRSRHQAGGESWDADRVARATGRALARCQRSDGAAHHVDRARRGDAVLTHVLIFAGGVGSRLAAVGVATPKALVSLAGLPLSHNLILIIEAIGRESTNS